MNILYEAKDGKIFRDENECYNYEYLLDYSEMFNIVFYDKMGSIYHINKENIFDDNIYHRSEKVRIHDEVELNCLRKLTKECGWCEFEQITAPGIWVRREIDDRGYDIGIWEKKGECINIC